VTTVAATLSTTDSSRLSFFANASRETSTRRAAAAEYSGSVIMTSPAPLILASRSPRRRQLLAEHGFAAHEAVHPGFEDAALKPHTTNPGAWVASLAYLKAWAKASDPASAGRVVIGADTACLLDGRLIGTPTTPEEAEGMIRAFIGREHEVLTGVAVIDLRGDAPVRHIFTDTARVRLGRLSEQQIADYIAGNHWQGKAGGYNYREALIAGWPLSHTGDVTTIMGLPMARLSGLLTRLGVPQAPLQRAKVPA
jgi:septum formation protein